MSNSTKALLCSAFIFPGAGLWLLGERGRACVFALPAAVAIINLTQGIWRIAQHVKEQLLSGELALDLPQIVAQVHLALAEASQLETSVWVFLAAWILGLASTYSVARLKQSRTAAE